MVTVGREHYFFVAISSDNYSVADVEGDFYTVVAVARDHYFFAAVSGDQ